MIVNEKLNLKMEQPWIAGIELGPTIGQGSFASVRLGKASIVEFNGKQSRRNDQYIAVKCFNMEAGTKQQQAIQREVAILSKCGNMSFVPKIQFAVSDESFFYIGMEYCAGGDLQSFVDSHDVSYEQTLFCLGQIAAGLTHLHNAQIIYHDLKLGNICIDEAGNCKLVDFGLATLLDDSTYNPASGRREVITSGGTLEYSAPEIFLRLPHGFEADWWSFGVLAYHMLSGAFPFFLEGATLIEQSTYICSNSEFHRNQVIANGSVEESFVSMFLEKNPRYRFGYGSVDVDDILEHEIFDAYDF